MPSFPVSIAFHSQAIGFGGGERQLATLALALDPARWKVHILFQRPGGPWQPRFEKAGIALHQIQLESYFRPSAVREALAVRQYLRQHNIRICHGFDFTSNVFVTPVGASVPGVISLSTQRCETRLIPAKYKALTRLAHRVSGGIVVNSQMVADELTAEKRYPAQRIHVLPNAIDTNAFCPQPRARLGLLRPEGPVIGAICVLRPEKNLQTLFTAFASILPRYPSLQLLIVGDGPERQALGQLAQALNIAASVVFAPATSDVPAYLRSIDIFVLPSISESLSNSLMEAMSCGCAPLAANLACNLELLPPDQHRLVFPALDATTLARNLAELIDNPELRSIYALEASAFIHSRFSIAAIVNRLESLYGRLLGENQSQ